MAVTINASTSAGLVQTADLSGGVNIQSNGTTVLTVAPTTLTTTINSATSQPPLITQINGTEAMRIDSSGKLLVGTTTANGTELLQFKAGGVQWSTGPNTTNGGFDVLNASGTGVYLSNGATSWAGLSDETLKDIIEPIADAVNKVSTLRAVIGKYKTDEEGTRRSFLIAQDVQKVLPEAINEDKNGKLGLQYTDTIPLLVAAIKEQQALIESLTTRLTALEAK